MTALRFFFILFFVNLFSFQSTAQDLPHIEAEVELVPSTSTAATLNTTLRIYDSSSIPAASITNIVILAELVDEVAAYNVQGWETDTQVDCLSPMISSVTIDPWEGNNMKAWIDIELNNNVPRNPDPSAPMVSMCPEAQIILVSGSFSSPEEEAQFECGNYGLKILTKSSYVVYLDETENIQSVKPTKADHIVDDCSGQNNPPAQPRMNRAEGSKLYPNPTKNAFTIEMESSSNLNVFDLSGKLILTAENLEGVRNFDISNWANGLYIVDVFNKETKKSEQLKLSVLQ